MPSTAETRAGVGEACIYDTGAVVRAAGSDAVGGACQGVTSPCVVGSHHPIGFLPCEVSDRLSGELQLLEALLHDSSSEGRILLPPRAEENAPHGWGRYAHGRRRAEPGLGSSWRTPV